MTLEDAANVVRLPATSREIAARVDHFRAEAVLPVELDGNRVLIRGQAYRTFTSVSNAARVASALMTLEALDLLDTVRVPEPPCGGVA